MEALERLIVCDGQPQRGFRKAIFNPDFKSCGICCDQHATHENVVQLLYVQRLWRPDEQQASRSQAFGSQTPAKKHSFLKTGLRINGEDDKAKAAYSSVGGGGSGRSSGAFAKKRSHQGPVAMPGLRLDTVGSRDRSGGAAHTTRYAQQKHNFKLPSPRAHETPRAPKPTTTTPKRLGLSKNASESGRRPASGLQLSASRSSAVVGSSRASGPAGSRPLKPVSS